MPTTSTVQITFSDPTCQIIRSGATAFTLRDSTGNHVTVELRDILRCLSIAEHEKLFPILPPEFWATAEQYK